MADYVSREVARERLRKACKLGTIASLVVLLAALAYAGITATVVMALHLPEIVERAMNIIVPGVTEADPNSAAAENGTKAVLLLLIAIIGLLMFRKVSRTGNAFRLGQLRQFKFIAFLIVLLGFLPTVVTNGIAVAMAIRSGVPFLPLIDLTVNRMCLAMGLFMFVALRVLVAGALLGSQESSAIDDPGEPDFASVPDLSNVPTAVSADSEVTTVGEYGTYMTTVDQTAEQPPSIPEL